MVKNKNLNENNTHKAFSKHFDDRDTVILFIHGFLESPNQFKELGNIVVENNMAFSAILLPGHNCNGKEFCKSNKKKWIDCVEGEINSLRKKYNKIILVGHSMGTLLSINAYSNNSKKICGMVLIATPLKIRLTLRGFTCSAKALFNIIKNNDFYTNAMVEASSVREKSIICHAGYVPRYLDLFALIRSCRKQIEKIEIPILIVHSDKDEFVRKGSLKILKNGLAKSKYKIITLKESGHFYYYDDENKNLIKEFTNFITSL